MDNEFIDPTVMIEGLIALAERHPLKGVELSRAKQLMRTLKQGGYTNKEIHELTNGTWSESTIKLYTRSTTGIQAGLKTAHLKIFNEIIRNDISVVELKKGLLLVSELVDGSSSFNDIIDILQYLQKEKKMIPYLIGFLSRLNHDGILVEKLVQLAQKMDELDVRGFDLEFMESLYELQKKYGDKQKALDSILAYDSISTIHNEINKTLAKRDEVNADIILVKKQLAELNIQKEKLRMEIGVVEELTSLGFTVSALREVREFAAKYGHDLSNLLKAVNRYNEMTEMESQISSLHSKKAALNDSVQNLEREYEQFGELPRMCRFFIDKFSFHLRDIAHMHKLVSEYGEPSEFFRVLDDYSSLKEIEQKIKKLRLDKLTLESGIQELVEKKSDLEARIGTLGETVVSTVQHISMGVGKVFSDTADRIGARLEQNLIEMRKLHDEYSKVRARILASNSKLQVAKIIQSIINNDLDVINASPLIYLTLFIQGALNICNARRINPSSHLDVVYAMKYGLVPSTPMQIVDLLEFAKIASNSLNLH
jgi:hypothetical protein